MTDIKDLHVILVSENVESAYKGKTSSSRRREMTDDKVTKQLTDALSKLCKRVDICNSPRELVDYAETDALVITVYGGEVSRNRMSLVPAMCESLGLKFAGADAFARFLCQDKNLTKYFVKELGFKTPDSVIIRSLKDIENIVTLSLPLVVKPNFEGSSIGIDDRNLVQTHEDAKSLANELLNKFDQPILIEEFCAGPEICICIVGSQTKITHLEVVEDVHHTDTKFLHNRLFTADLKRGIDVQIGHRLVTNQISEHDLKKVKEVFFALGKVDYLRVDCRINSDGYCVLIELTPDPFMARTGSFGNSWQMTNISYEDGIKMILETALKNY